VPCEQGETLNNLGELLIRSSDSRHAPVHYRRRTVIDCVTAAHAERRDLDDWRSAETGPAAVRTAVAVAGLPRGSAFGLVSGIRLTMRLGGCIPVKWPKPAG
jgi:hypothetical protein